MVSVFYIFEEVLLESQASGKAFHDHLHHLMARKHEVQHLLPAIKTCQMHACMHRQTKQQLWAKHSMIFIRVTALEPEVLRSF